MWLAGLLVLGFTTLTLLFLKRRRDFRRKLKELRDHGYYPTDAISAVFEAMQRSGAGVTINSFQTCSDSFDINRCVEFCQNLAAQHLPFRSILELQQNTYFWIECTRKVKTTNISNSYQQTQNVDQSYGFDICSRVKYVEMADVPAEYMNKIAAQSDKGVTYDLDDVLMEFIGEFVSDKKNGFPLRPDWLHDYTHQNIPNWNVFYFHFKSLSRCVIHLQINHSYTDGILLSRIIQNMHLHMNNINNKNNYKPKLPKLDFNSASPLKILKTRFPPKTLYWYRSLLRALMEVLVFPDSYAYDPVYPSFDRNVSGEHILCFGGSIDVHALKRVAKAQTPRATVNELLYVLTIKAVGAYLELQQDPTYLSLPAKDATLGGLFACSVRATEESQLQAGIAEYSKSGLYANMSGQFRLRLCMRDAVTKDVAEKSEMLRHGSVSWLLHSIMWLLKYNVDIERFIQNSMKYGLVPKIEGLTMSNYIGPNRLMPTDQQNEEFVTGYWAGASGPLMPLMVTFVTYVDKCKMSMSMDTKYIKNPKMMRQCWFNQWEKYFSESCT